MPESYWPYLVVAIAGIAAALLLVMLTRRKTAATLLVAGSVVLFYVAYAKRSETVPGPAAERTAIGVAEAWVVRLARGDAKDGVEQLWRSPDRPQISARLAAQRVCLGKGVSREFVGRESSQYAPGRPLVRLRY